MGDGRIFLKGCRDASFKKYLSIEPNFKYGKVCDTWTWNNTDTSEIH